MKLMGCLLSDPVLRMRVGSTKRHIYSKKTDIADLNKWEAYEADVVAKTDVLFSLNALFNAVVVEVYSELKSWEATTCVLVGLDSISRIGSKTGSMPKLNYKLQGKCPVYSLGFV